MSEGADRSSDLRAEIEAARRELAETAEALAAHAPTSDAARPVPAAEVSSAEVSSVEVSSVEVVPAASQGSKAPVLYRPVPPPRRRAAFGLALGVAALLLRRLTR